MKKEKITEGVLLVVLYTSIAFGVTLGIGLAITIIGIYD